MQIENMILFFGLASLFLCAVFCVILMKFYFSSKDKNK